MLRTLAIAHDRSLLSLAIELGPLNLIVGPNGSGKSNVYRVLRLLAVTAQGCVVSALAREAEADCRTFVLRKKLGQTLVDGQDLLSEPRWSWPPR